MLSHEEGGIKGEELLYGWERELYLVNMEGGALIWGGEAKTVRATYARKTASVVCPTLLPVWVYAAFYIYPFSLCDSQVRRICTLHTTVKPRSIYI